MLVMGAFLLPFDTVPLHLSSKVSFFGAHPLIPLGIAPCAAFEILRGERLLERYTGIQSALAAGDERNKVNMQMRRCLVHV